MGKKSLLEKFKESEGVYDVPVRDFDIENMSDDQHDQMLGDVCGGYKTKKVPRYETRGAGRDGTADVQTGYDDEINYDYYKNNKAWQQTADAVGISGAINNEQELGKMAHYITQYGMDKGDAMPEVPEVGVYFEYQLFRGNRTHKANTDHFEAFISANYPPLAEADVHLKFNRRYCRKINEETLQVHTKMNANTVVLKLFPGITKQIVQAI